MPLKIIKSILNQFSLRFDKNENLQFKHLTILICLHAQTTKLFIVINNSSTQLYWDLRNQGNISIPT